MIIITLPAICLYLPNTDWVACDPPPIHEICFSLTSYDPFNEHGELVPYNGQADEDPTRTANGYQIHSTDQYETFVAAPYPLVGETFCNDQFGCVPIHDTFGNEIYQAGAFWHKSYDQFVIPIDVISDQVIHYLDCNAEIVH